MCQQQHHSQGRRLPVWAASPGSLAAAAALEALPASGCCDVPADKVAALQQQPAKDSLHAWAAAAGSRVPELGSGGSRGGSRGGSAPSTPSHACSLATVTPPTGAPAQSSAGSTAAVRAAVQGVASQAAAAAAAANALSACPKAVLQQHVIAFQACVSMSPMVQSALLYLECDGSHPPPACLRADDGAADDSAEPAAGLECTLAQLLALHLRAGYQQGALRWHVCCAVPCLRAVPAAGLFSCQHACPANLPPGTSWSLRVPQLSQPAYRPPLCRQYKSACHTPPLDRNAAADLLTCKPRTAHKHACRP